MGGEIAAALQYGALGLLGLVLIGVAWYVKNVEARQSARDEYERQERGRYLDTLVGLIKTLTVIGERLEAHELRDQERHTQFVEKFEALCESMELLARATGDRRPGTGERRGRSE